MLTHNSQEIPCTHLQQHNNTCSHARSTLTVNYTICMLVCKCTSFSLNSYMPKMNLVSYSTSTEHSIWRTCQWPDQTSTCYFQHHLLLQIKKSDNLCSFNYVCTPDQITHMFLHLVRGGTCEWSGQRGNMWMIWSEGEHVNDLVRGGTCEWSGQGEHVNDFGQRGNTWVIWSGGTCEWSGQGEHVNDLVRRNMWVVWSGRTCEWSGQGEHVSDLVGGTCEWSGQGEHVSDLVMGNMWVIWSWGTCEWSGQGEHVSDLVRGNMWMIWSGGTREWSGQEEHVSDLVRGTSGQGEHVNDLVRGNMWVIWSGGTCGDMAKITPPD